MENMKEVQTKLRESFIQNRTKQETAFNAWIKEFEVLPPEKKLELGIKDGMTFRDIFPEYFADIPNKEIYDQQYNNLCAFTERLNAYCDELAAEASKILEEYNAIQS